MREFEQRSIGLRVKGRTKMNKLKKQILNYIEHESALREFLCCGLSADPNWHQEELETLWSRVDPKDAFGFACEHEAQGAVWSALSAASIDNITKEWQESHAVIEKRLGVYMSHLDRVSIALAEVDIKLVALKNSGIARGIYQDLGSSVMGDVDLLICGKDLERAHEIFLSEGFSLLGNQDAGREALGEIMDDKVSADTNLDTEHDSFIGGREYALYLDGHDPLWFELQTRSIGGKWIPEHSEPSADDLIDDSVSIEGTAVRLLCPEDNLLQVCLHTTKHSYVRVPGFRLHTDVDRIVRFTDVNWEEFLRKVKALHVKTAVYYALLFPSVLLRTPIPEGVLMELRPGSLKNMILTRSIYRADLFHPRKKKWSKLGYLFFLVLLYDSFSQLRTSIFPDKKWMMKKYKLKPSMFWWLCYFKRFLGWIFKRANT